MTKCGNEKTMVLEASLWLSRNGYFGTQRGTGGNVSLRISESSMAITPSSMEYEKLSPDDIVVVDFDMVVIEGKNGIKPSVESLLHSTVYRNRPDCNAVVHSHQIYGSVLSLINTPVPALFDEVSFALGPLIDVIPYGLSGSPELAANTAAKLSNNANAYIIQNHGILALGKTMNQALLHAELLEKVAHTYCLALSTGRTVTTLPQSIADMFAALRHNDVNKARVTRKDGA
jgi:ribulose-5-phosphate 4-epimerase/fuculose-1-phosphate aldolase